MQLFNKRSLSNFYRYWETPISQARENLSFAVNVEKNSQIFALKQKSIKHHNNKQFKEKFLPYK